MEKCNPKKGGHDDFLLLWSCFDHCWCKTPGLKEHITLTSNEGRRDCFSSALLFLTILYTYNSMGMSHRLLVVDTAYSAVIFNRRFTLGVGDLLSSLTSLPRYQSSEMLLETLLQFQTLSTLAHKRSCLYSLWIIPFPSWIICFTPQCHPQLVQTREMEDNEM